MSESGEIRAPGRAVVRVSPELIHDLLHMPDTARIVNAGMSADGLIDVLVESPDLPFYGPIPTIDPTVTHHPERYEWSWGIDAKEATDG